ncbi:MAG: DUF1499 domain-containing protein [Myxococcota bacterium]|nr:DUF1499 domain-containing protein [Myxococcota bacterium]
METPSRVAVWAGRIGLLGVLLGVGGPALSQLGTPAIVGFYAFALGGLFGLLALVLGAIGLLTTRAAPGRSQAVRGMLFGAALVAALAYGARPGAGLPPINDITTSPDDPPEFVTIAANRGVDMSYPGAEFAEQQQRAYGDLQPLTLDLPPGQVYQQAREVASALGWDVVAEDPMGGRIEASHSTRVFRFVDDVVIRIRPVRGAGVVVDVRSKSRDGRGDLGANAARIRAFQDALRAQAS